MTYVTCSTRPAHSCPIAWRRSSLPTDRRSPHFQSLLRTAAIFTRRRHRRRLLFNLPFVHARLTCEEHAQAVGPADGGPPRESHSHRASRAFAVDPHESSQGKACAAIGLSRTTAKAGTRASKFANRCGESGAREHDRSACVYTTHQAAMATSTPSTVSTT